MRRNSIQPLARLRPSPALIVALIALLLATSGAAVALDGKGSVGAKEIRKNAVRSKHVKAKSLKGGDLADSTISGKQVGAESLDGSDLRGFEIADDSLIRVGATQSATSLANARASAPETILLEAGELTVYAKCYRDSAAGEIEGGLFARSDQPGAMLSGEGHLPNDDASLLGPGIPEPDRALDLEATGAADAADFDEGEAVLAGPDGSSLHLLSTIGIKQGTVADGEGVFGTGDACVFALTSTG